MKTGDILLIDSIFETIKEDIWVEFKNPIRIEVTRVPSSHNGSWQFYGKILSLNNSIQSNIKRTNRRTANYPTFNSTYGFRNNNIHKTLKIKLI